jgi:uncharacterized protein YecT (DUF1311 family)
MKLRWLLCTLLIGLAGTAHAAGTLHVVTKTIADKNAIYDISVAYPQTGIKAIDDDLTAWAEGQAADFRKNSNEDHQTGELAYVLEAKFAVARNDAQGFAVLFDIYEDTGGAHPNHDFYTANYLMPDGWRVYLPELLNSQGLKRIGALTQADLDRRIATGPDAQSDPDTIKSGTTPEWDNFRNFLLLPKTLAIHFPPYQVASYASGPQQSLVPLASLGDVMRPDPRKPAASFDCAAARTVVEQALCSDVALARLDRAVAETYEMHLSQRTDDASKASLRTNQRAWLASRDGTCAAAGARAACLNDFYKARLAWLARQP